MVLESSAKNCSGRALESRDGGCFRYYLDGRYHFGRGGGANQVWALQERERERDRERERGRHSPQNFKCGPRLRQSKCYCCKMVCDESTMLCRKGLRDNRTQPFGNNFLSRLSYVYPRCKCPPRDKTPSTPPSNANTHLICRASALFAPLLALRQSARD